MAVGIKDVAKVAGVSPATVSRVLAGRTVDAEMSERVLAAVKSTGYRPNLAARRLRSQHTNTIGLVVADIRNPFFTAVSRAVESLAAARGLRVILCNTDEDPEKEAAYLELLHEERVSGVILAPTRQRVAAAGQLELDYPVVLIDRSTPDGEFDSVVLDNARMAEVLVEHVHAQGHRRVTGLFGASSSTGIERREGFRKAAERLGLDADAVAVPHAPQAAAQAIADLLDSNKRPDALIASNGVMLLNILRALRDLGLEVPRDIALAGFDNNDWMEFVGGGISVIEQPVEEIGRTAMTMLLDRLDHPDAPARKVVLGGRLVVRGSSLRTGAECRVAGA
ncbi:LacI family DNA-binding transcriptional regulator [Novosphingobium sp. PP1Y]|uniref:LacI family DNA-binding transcriptional regulator n=1 Tax=Novosphingobium sp. PP1Y TaxID=702113 RepID=UPI00020EF84D|nr:LacI family DNA-binding transcriptional regulator [Novosphingobium sp. PP1Y]CCA90645.1 LacI family transcriptional regulator, fructose operon transcriptional repressor [Novosphingobium sp. PP1Y]